MEYKKMRGMNNIKKYCVACPFVFTICYSVLKR